MNYRHAYHAGNVGDVLKHVALLSLLERLLAKPAPLLFLDTHAGRGLYDLASKEAVRGAEWHDGIGRVLATAGLPPAVEQYAQRVRRFNAERGETGLRFYPGSPLLALELLRKEDRKVFVEKHPEEAQRLREQTRGRRNLSVLAEDGYTALKAQLPPRENRGLVLLDPPFENPAEFTDLGAALVEGYGRWPTGVYAAWYPIKAGDGARRLHEHVMQAGLRKLLLVELTVRPHDSPTGLSGSGLLLINPPWKFDELMRSTLPALHRCLAPEGMGGTRVEWLAGE